MLATGGQNLGRLNRKLSEVLCDPPHRHLHQLMQRELGADHIHFYKSVFIWQTAQTLMRRRILRRLIWVYAVCVRSFFACIQPVPLVRTLNFRLATPLIITLAFCGWRLTIFQPVTSFVVCSRIRLCSYAIYIANNMDPVQTASNEAVGNSLIRVHSEWFRD